MPSRKSKTRNTEKMKGALVKRVKRRVRQEDLGPVSSEVNDIGLLGKGSTAKRESSNRSRKDEVAQFFAKESTRTYLPKTLVSGGTDTLVTEAAPL